MKKTSGVLSSMTLAVLLLFVLLLMAQQTFAAINTEDTPEDGKVEIIYPAERMAPYKERRSTFSTLFVVGMDQVLPDKFRSQISSSTYNDLFKSSPVKVVQAEIGTKLNFALGGLGLTAIYGSGLVSEGDGGGDSYSLKLSKKGVGVHLILDNLFAEPYVAPFVEAQYVNFDWVEKQPGNVQKSGTTDFTSAIRMGISVQLNWMDPDAAINAQDSSGLENAYLDLFVSQYSASSSSQDPNFQTGMNYGGGLRLEF